MSFKQTTDKPYQSPLYACEALKWGVSGNRYRVLTADRQLEAPLIDSTVTFAWGDIYSMMGDYTTGSGRLLSGNSYR